MRTIRTKVYQFSELSEQAQKKVVENMYSINVDHDWWKSTYDDAERIGLKLTSFDLDRNRNAKGGFLFAANEVAANIFKEHGEMCETYKTAQSFMKAWEPVFAEYMDENSDKYESYDSEQIMIGLEDDFLNSLLEDYSIILEKEFDYLQSFEAIKETIEANEYEFTIDGNRF